MANIKIPSPSSILDSPNTAPVAARGKPASPPKRTKQIATKPKQTKSRNGCITCKAKRLKCDETKPSCDQCQRRKVNCGGYKKDFKWRPFEETNLAVGRPTATKSKDVDASRPASSVTIPENFPTPPTTEQSGSPILPRSKLYNKSPPESVQYESPAGARIFASVDTQSPEDTIVGHDVCQNSIPGISVPVTEDPDHMSFLSFLDPFPASGSFDERFNTDPEIDTGLGPMSFDLLDYQSPSHPPVLSFSQLLDNDQDSIEEIIRKSDPNSDFWDAGVVGNDAENYELPQLPGGPALSPESQEMLAMRFDKLTCGILSVKDGMTENPWRTQIWPLAKGTPALYHAIFALSAFHSAKENPSLRVHGVKHMRQSIACLRQHIQSMRADTALATSLALAFADTWDQNTRTCIQHLRGAKALMLQILNAGLRDGLSDTELDRIRFLYNTWTYMDVIARLTSLDDSGPQDLDPDIFQFPGDAVHEIDPLMGSAATLFPLIGRVARLVQRVRKTSSNSVSIVAQAMELKSLVENWEPPHWFEPPEDPISEVQHSIQVAYAYRSAILLYLHQAVPEMPSEPAEELAKRVLILLATVPPTSRTTIIQMFPLLAAGAEVDMDDDRKWVLERWATVQSRLMLGGVDRCLDIIREVWSRRDALKAERQHQEHINNGRTGSFSSEARCNMSPGFLSPETTNSRTLHNRVNSRDISNQHGRPGPSISKPSTSRRGSALSPLENIEFERTVRSNLHWVNVMEEWGWEGKKYTLAFLSLDLLTFEKCSLADVIA
ncbi:hypothetical protein N7492_002525 [Penicillium capsulatum]|uniref:Zn(2)-C6 fungal-type domain-containing protein n=1 Tax=Penicillium capsulatum TaxID=69766 RepID=A0A9W9IIR3_9EURO|nr:hypothetical protein N7492_002525 [Penicillium capsulatum]